ncbi:NAD(P)-dependent oxidoreductase [Paenibacillus sp. JX-17]|uniref:NAD(P)-dependent oxidoreductase n=1 Tax=Paenibacillus lacisoli TaxID=3064525 RepID=A0ABT9CFK0_9BACL|nr:NAD(P)-dependent oxidoreductase [Paenibacillus sp. JX-17]MDO7906717.1 NAD(P)-dependent oxidoreductase [Paenibacillus sp. JX-17]
MRENINENRRVIVFGATGKIGHAIIWEALDRGYQVTAAVRDPQRMKLENERLQVITADILRPDSIAEAARGHDAIVSAYGPQFGAEEELLEVARCLIEGARRAEVPRLLIVGGAGSLKVESGDRLMDTPEFPEELRPLAQAHADAYDIYKEADVSWTYFSPAALIEEGRRFGNFRIGTDQLVTDELGNSKITIADYAAAMMDELDEGHFERTRFTVGY